MVIHILTVPPQGPNYFAPRAVLARAEWVEARGGFDDAELDEDLILCRGSQYWPDATRAVVAGNATEDQYVEHYVWLLRQEILCL